MNRITCSFLSVVMLISVTWECHAVEGRYNEGELRILYLFLKPVKLTRCIFNQSRPFSPNGFPLAKYNMLLVTSPPKKVNTCT